MEKETHGKSYREPLNKQGYKEIHENHKEIHETSKTFKVQKFNLE
jgi:hypothetical protein